MYLYALVFNSTFFIAVIGFIGMVCLFIDKKISPEIKIASLSLLAPLGFNILALFLGHSVLFIQGISGDSWFNVRYGVMVMPSIAIFVGYLFDRAKLIRPFLLGIIIFVLTFAFYSQDAVTIDDARVGSSQKNVSEVSGWLSKHTSGKRGFVLISAASHDAIIFSSGLPMKKFIHEGTGAYWTAATTVPDRWARWIVMRTYDDADLVYHSVKKAPGLSRYGLVAKYPFADIYELKPEFVSQVQTEAVFGKQK
jgi:hypothetical protein